MKKHKSMKKIKKMMYKGRTKQLRTLIVLMLIGGIAASALYFVRYAYIEYAVSTAHIILSYPEIAKSGYPDGSRFVYYDFISDEKLEEALDIMKKEGKYKNLEVCDIKDNFYIEASLDNSASAEVSSARSEGNDFSYVANEYKITFVQPHDYKNNNFIKKFVSKDYSSDFLKALTNVNEKYVSEVKGGMAGFRVLTELDTEDANYDYDERTKVYRAKLKAIASHISALEKKAPKFKSKKHNMSLKDLKGKYEILESNRLNAISSFIESAGVSKDAAVATNKIRVNIENNILKYNKYLDRTNINQYAMTNYDHTFTENLINVVRDNTQGLYQARPKTSFDTVVAQKNESQEAVAEYKEALNVLDRELIRLSNATTVPEEYARLEEKCEKLLDSFVDEYNELTIVAREIIAEYLDDTNGEFILAKIKKKGLISLGLLIDLGIAFVVGALLLFVLGIMGSMLSDAAALRRKLKQMAQIKNAE